MSTLPLAPAGALNRGVVAALLSGLCWSIGGVLVRSVQDASPWDIVFWRSSSMVVALLAWLAFRYGRATVQVFRSIGWFGVFAGLVSGTCSTLFILALHKTTVANVLFLIAAQPAFCALFAWIFLREPVSRAMVLAMGLAFGGVVVMVADGLGLGTWLGNLLALGVAVLWAAFTVLVRAGRSVDMLPVLIVSGVFSVAVALVVQGGDVAISLRDFIPCLAVGVVQLGLGNALFVAASTRVPAAQLSLLGLSEVVLGVLWVWLFIGETPTAMTMVGGTVVLLAIAYQAGQAMRAGPAAPPP
ncbi:DMT family transporter [Zavarzinia sp. CC-PAN008]|uniref:DMT family transporter n=1 Tax=Zavarzinia sp. CC-PAN008 TaxID=3243332 RepID=UPI003F748AC6